MDLRLIFFVTVMGIFRLSETNKCSTEEVKCLCIAEADLLNVEVQWSQLSSLRFVVWREWMSVVTRMKVEMFVEVEMTLQHLLDLVRVSSGDEVDDGNEES